MFRFHPYLWLCVSLSDEEELGRPPFLASVRDRVSLFLPWLPRSLVGDEGETRADRDLSPPDSSAMSALSHALSRAHGGREGHGPLKHQSLPAVARGAH